MRAPGDAATWRINPTAVAGVNLRTRAKVRGHVWIARVRSNALDDGAVTLASCDSDFRLWQICHNLNALDDRAVAVALHTATGLSHGAVASRQMAHDFNGSG